MNRKVGCLGDELMGKGGGRCGAEAAATRGLAAPPPAETGANDGPSVPKRLDNVNEVTCASAEASSIIDDNANAPYYCPQTCARVGADWDNQWTQSRYTDTGTGAPQVKSACNCCTETFRSEPTTRISNDSEAASKCVPTCASVGKLWSSNWLTMASGSTCVCMLKQPEERPLTRRLLGYIPATSDINWSGYSHVVNRHTEGGSDSQGNSIFAQVATMNWLQALRNLYDTGNVVENNESGGEIIIKLRYVGTVGYTAFGVAVNYVKFIFRKKSGRWFLTTAYPVAS